MNDWYNSFENQVLESIKDCKGSDLRFFRIEEYLRNAERIDRMASSCKTCTAIRGKMQNEVASIKQAIDEPGKARKTLDNIQDELINHLKKEHGFYPPMYHTYMQSIYWLIGVMTLAFVCTKIFPNIPTVACYSPAFIIGVAIGQIRGSKMDRQVSESNKQL